MNTRTQERVERWESRSFSGGYGGLRDLADSDFTGAVEAAGAWLFMLNGRVVGVHEGSIEDFESASGTAHVAPDPALPLLFSMWETGGETQGKYYTEDTAVSEVDDTLTSGSFTGYLELSENVLSGDYYVVYYGGRSMSAAFVGNKEELIGGDEAFERADDEVGIYEVIDVDVDVIEIPESDDAAAGSDDPGADDRDSPSLGSAAPGDADDALDADPKPSTADPARGPANVDGLADTDAPEDDGRQSADERSADAADRIAGYEDVEFDGEPSDSGVEVGDGVAEVDDGVDDDLPDELVDDVEPMPPSDDAPTEEETPVEDRSPVDEQPSVDDAPPAGHEPAAEDRYATSTGGDRASESRADSTDAVEAPEPVESDVRDDAPAEPSNASTEPTDAADVGTSPATEDSPPAGSSPARDDRPVGRDEPTVGNEEAPRGPERAATGGTADSIDAADGADPAGGADATDDVDWENVKTIPSLDPDHSSTPEPDDAARSVSSPSSGSTGGTAAAGGAATGASPSPRSDGRAGSRSQNGAASGRGNDDGGRSSQDPSGRSQRDSGRRSKQDSAPRSAGADRQRAPSGQPANDGPSREALEKREKALEKRAERIEELEAAVERIRDEREQLATERDRLDEENGSLREEVAQLEGEIERLESEVERLESALADAGVTAHDAETQLHPSEAIAGTNLFVRYRSKGDATLASAHAGDADADAVNGNVRLERHTQFDADSAAVNGQPYGEFLESTLEYRFVRWTVEQLLYEIRDTGHAGGLKDLYDALPDVDRAELGGEVDIVYEEDGERITEQATFDVVLRDRMGNPLVVADLNDSRDPATESMLVELESAASRIKQANEELSAAFLVTSSFFEPGALEAVAEATSGSLLSRDSRESFVKLSRKQGYHLCLVEARADEFHINVPEL